MQQGEQRIYPVAKAEGKAEAKAEAVLAILETRGLGITPEERARILSCNDLAVLDTMLRAAVTCEQVASLFAH